MMIIKKLELQGFKSFSERTRLIFHPGITAVIGPNGTGKSNIVDAMLWVLRGGRMKGQRGDRSGDVIFNGSANKPPLSMGDVSLILGDDNQKDDEDLTINHRVYRSGENEYRLNGKLVRLKDIQDMLWKHAIGEADYFVIEQGSVGTFLSSKPMEKRLLLEEAAGTAFYKDKKRQAHNKLANSEQNLIRLEDIIIEVEKAVNSLKRQAQAAIRYRKLREDIRELTLSLYRKKIDELESNQVDTAAHYRGSLDRENALISRIRIEEKELAGLRKQVWSSEQELKERQEKLFAEKSRQSRLEAEKEREEKRVDFFTEKRTTTEASRRELHEELEALEKDRKQTNRNLEENEKALAEKRERLAEAEEADEAIRKDLQTRQSSIENVRGAYLKILSEQNEIKSEAVKQEKEIELIARQTEKLKDELGMEGERLTESDGHLSARKQEISRLRREQDRLSDDITTDQGALEENRAALEVLDRRRTDLEHRSAEHSHQLKALRKMLEHERSSGEESKLPGVLGLFADKIDSSPDHAPLVDVFYKEETRAVLIHARDLLSAAPEQRLKGRFLLLHPETDREPPPELYEDKRVLGLLKSHLRTESALKPHLKPLRDAAIVRDIRGAVELWLDHPRHNYVTLDGDVLLASGLLNLGQKKEGLITLKQEMRTLEKGLVSLTRKLEPVTTEIETRISERNRLEERLRGKTTDLAKLETGLADLNREQSFGETEGERIRSRTVLLEQEIGSLSKERASASKHLQTQVQKIETLEQEKARAQQSAEAEEERLEKLRREGEQDRRRFFELRSEIDVLQEKISGLQRQQSQISNRIRAVKERMTSLDTELESSGGEKEELEKRIRDLGKQAELLHREIEGKQTGLERDEARMLERQKTVEKHESVLERLRQEAESAKEDRVKWEVRKAERERDLVNLEESSWQELKKTIEEVKQDVESSDIQIEETERRLEEGKDKLQRFKAVNLMAEEEYQIQKERFDFLSKEKDDLVESIAGTREAIRKIDQESKQQFLKALVAVNKNFQDIFAILFKGGTAQVKLTDENQPLESGVEIVAQPPGKKVQSLTLLSGGEKSLTSLAFFFALFRYKPAPFCILDEVDAALDEANLTRFLTLMKTIKHQTQFIIITHNFKTMEVADYIYGTTMAEPNITNMYSVKMEGKRIRKALEKAGVPPEKPAED